MKLEKKDINLFKVLNQSKSGLDLIDYLERTIAELFDPNTLTKDNLDMRKETANFIKSNLIDRIKLSSKDKPISDPNDYL